MAHKASNLDQLALDRQVCGLSLSSQLKPSTGGLESTSVTVGEMGMIKGEEMGMIKGGIGMIKGGEWE